jgi:hypothetical protein
MEAARQSLAAPTHSAEPTVLPALLSAKATMFIKTTLHIPVTIQEQHQALAPFSQTLN